MSGETGKDESGWTTDTLAHHLQQQINMLADHFSRQIDTMGESLQRQHTEFQQQIERRFGAQEHSVGIAFEAHKALTDTAVGATSKAVDAALAAQKEAVQVQAMTQQAASNVLSETLSKRDAQQNEWRQSLEDFNRRAMPRAEANAWNERATERLREQAAEIAKMRETMVPRTLLDSIKEREAERYATLEGRFNVLETRLTRAESLTQGAQGNQKGMYAALAALGTVMAIVVVVINLVTR